MFFLQTFLEEGTLKARRVDLRDFAAWQRHEVAEEMRSNVNLIASGLSSVIRNATPIIQDGELIVGYNYGDAGFEWL